MDKTWTKIIAKEQQLAYFQKLVQKVSAERQKHEVYPKEIDTFRAFDLCRFEQVKVVILGQDPYINYNQATGLAFSLPKEALLTPSLKNIFMEIVNDLAIDNTPHGGDLEKWASQGVLLLNCILSVEAHKSNSHKGLGWEQFTNNIITQLDRDHQPKVFMLWGNYAISKKTLINNPVHLVLTAPHPSPLSAYRGFFGCQHFSKANTFLVANTREPIDWSVA